MNPALDALLLAAGRVVATPALRRSAGSAGLVVAADGGLRHARSLGVEPQLLVGDLDSVDDAALRRWPGVERVVHPRDKDALDLEIAMREVVSRGARSVLVVGALGDRIDQSLAGIAIAEHAHRGGVEVTLDSGDARVLPLRPGETRHEAIEAGTVFSVIATRAATRVSLVGARWTLDASPIEPGTGVGVSNVATDAGPSLTLHEGGCLLVVPRLATPAAATIWGAQDARVQSGLEARDPALADLVRRVAYDEVFERPGLDLRTRELLALAHLITVGRDVDLRTHLIGALRAGATPTELAEVVLHAAMFVGFPRALAAADAVRDVIRGDAP